MDDQLLGQGNPFEGMNLEFETTVGSHVLKTRACFSKKKGKYSDSFGIHPIQFMEPGSYRITGSYAAKGLFSLVDNLIMVGNNAPNQFTVARIR